MAELTNDDLTKEFGAFPANWEGIKEIENQKDTLKHTYDAEKYERWVRWLLAAKDELNKSKGISRFGSGN